jgi:hypothetical protein
VLKFRANLNLDRPIADGRNYMNGPVAMARVLSAVDLGDFRKCAQQHILNPILRQDIFHNQPTAGDILYLA